MEATLATTARRLTSVFHLINEPGGEGAAARHRFDFLTGNGINLAELEIVPVREEQVNYDNLRSVQKALKHYQRREQQLLEEAVRVRTEKKTEDEFWVQTCASLNLDIEGKDVQIDDLLGSLEYHEAENSELRTKLASEGQRADKLQAEVSEQRIIIETLKQQASQKPDVALADSETKDAQIDKLQDVLQSALQQIVALRAEVTEQKATIETLKQQASKKPKAPTVRQRDCLAKSSSGEAIAASKVVIGNCRRAGWLDQAGSLTELGLQMLALPVPVSKPRIAWKKLSESLESVLFGVTDILDTTDDAWEAVTLAKESIAKSSCPFPRRAMSAAAVAH